MGLIQLPSLESYWSSSWIGKVSFFGSTFQRNIFEQIFWMLHVSKDDPLQPGKKSSVLTSIYKRPIYGQTSRPDSLAGRGAGHLQSWAAPECQTIMLQYILVWV